MDSWVTFVFLAIVLFTFLPEMPEPAPITGVTSRAAASTAARAVGTAQRPAPVFRNRINPSLSSDPHPDGGAARAPLHGHRRAIPKVRLLVLELGDVRELLLQPQDGLEEITLLLDALDRRRDLEAELLRIAPLGGALDLTPVQRDRGGRMLSRP